MTKIKICGLKTAEDIAIVNRYLPDYIGFVFARSKRQITKQEATRLKYVLGKSIKAVGVFVNVPIENIIQLCKDNVIDIVQLHGEEDYDYITSLKQHIDIPIIKAVRVQSTEQILKAEKLPCDMLLLDAFVNDKYGGSGKLFDYNLIPKLEKPFFLAGGINEENAFIAIEKARPMCVDVSSGVETNGQKDRKKIKNIIEIVRKIK